MALAWNDWTAAVTAGVAGVSDDALARAAAEILRAGFVITAGNGGSASLASHAAQAISKPGYAAGGGRAAVCLSDHTPTLTAHANDGGWESALLESARPFLESIPRCAVLLFSSSGRSKNVCALAEAAVTPRYKCGLPDLASLASHPVIAFTGFDGGPLRQLATVSLHIDSSDYEVIEPVHDALIHRMQYHLRTLQ